MRRIEYSGAFGHVTARGNDKQAIFLDDVDYMTFLRMLAQVVAEFGWRCHAYCLMPNHYHLLLETPEPNLGRGMHVLNGRYARRFNERHGHVGHVFQGPYHREPVERDEHLAETCRYIALNPVRAGLCERPEDWPWSSYSAGHVPFVFDSAEAYRRFVADGLNDWRRRSAAARTLLSSRMQSLVCLGLRGCCGVGRTTGAWINPGSEPQPAWFSEVVVVWGERLRPG
jgi:REP element-mobilizing transposase RayT